jgi:hypothetical protein
LGFDLVESTRKSLFVSSRLGWIGVVTLTAALTAASTYQSLRRYEELQSGWSWDLAYYNQWLWCLTHGERTITVRPVSAYAQEGPSIWKMNYLAPIRLALAPLYALAPDPRTLLVIQNVFFWWVIPAAYSLVRSESRSDAVALAAAALVPVTPLFWPLVWNDFRELQLVAPFVLWAVQGVRERSARLAAVGIAGMLACRQEFAIIVASFAILPPRQAEPLDVTSRWRRRTLLGGVAWILFGFFGYLRFVVGRGAPDAFINQFLGPKASLGETLATSAQTLVVGMGAWAFLACLAPRVAILAVPWVWSLCSGQWALRFLESPEWHHVRYCVPMVVTVLAAGLIGYARLCSWLLSRGAVDAHDRRTSGEPAHLGKSKGHAHISIGRWARLGLARRAARDQDPQSRISPWVPGGLAALWLVVVVVCVLGLRGVLTRLDRVPVAISREEAGQIWQWIRQVGPHDAVLADYAVAAPLSSRRQLYSYILDTNLPPGFPHLGPEFRWLFVRNDFAALDSLLAQGFVIVHRGAYLTIARRGVPRDSSSYVGSGGLSWCSARSGEKVVRLAVAVQYLFRRRQYRSSWVGT